MTKLLNIAVPTNANDEFWRHLLSCGLSSVSLFYCELLAREEIKGHACAAVARDVYGVYKAWCMRLGSRPCALPHFVNVLRKQHGVQSKRVRYVIDGKRVGPHGVLVLGTKDNTLDAQLAAFRQFAISLQTKWGS